MANLTNFVFNEAEFKRLCSAQGEVGEYVIGLGLQVVAQAALNASGSGHPRIRSHDLISNIRAEVGTNENGVLTVDVGSSATHGGHNYPSYIEAIDYTLFNTGLPGPHYPWLVPALETVMSRN